MYKKCALCLALIVLSGRLATAGEIADVLSADSPEVAQGPLWPFFAEPVQPCSAELSREELATPSLLQTFYAELGYKPVWQSQERRTLLADTLLKLAEDGLEPTHYPLPEPLLEQDCADILNSRAYLRALQHLSRGKVEQARVEPFWRAPDSINPDPRPSVLTLAWQGLDDLPGAFAAARPTLPQYQLLRQAYGQLRNQPQQERPLIPAGRLLKPGMRDTRVPALSARLAAEGYLPILQETDGPASDLYDETLADAVRRFQVRHDQIGRAHV